MNVLFIDIDSLRVDHVGAYGYPKGTTPAIDSVAADGIRFGNAYAANSPCLPARAGLISGRYGINTGVVTHGPSSQQLSSPKNTDRWYACWAESWEPGGRSSLAENVGESQEWLTLPEVFFHERVRTAAVSSFPRHTAPWFYHLWHEYYQPQEPDRPREYMQTPRGRTVADRCLRFLDDTESDPFFLYAQFWDPHTPYNRSADEIEAFRAPPYPEFPTPEQHAEHHDWDAWRSASQLDLDGLEDLYDLIAHYDAEIAYVDHQVGRILDRLRRTDRYDETCVVIIADHGEAFGEHGVYRDHWSVHEPTQRIPLIVKPPTDVGHPSGESRSELTTTVDLAPTLADYAGFRPPSQWQGASLVPVITDSTENWRDAVVLEHGLYTAQRAIRRGRWKFVRTYDAGLWGARLPDRQLFNLRADPHEQVDVFQEEPTRAADLERAMRDWVDRMAGSGDDPLRRVAREGPPGAELQRRWNGWSGV